MSIQSLPISGQHACLGANTSLIQRFRRILIRLVRHAVTANHLEFRTAPWPHFQNRAWKNRPVAAPIRMQSATR